MMDRQIMSFDTKLKSIISDTGSHTAITISPDIDLIPQHILRYDEPFLPLGKAIFDATSQHVCAYVFDLPAYMALGAVGMIALERTIDYVGFQHITILDGQFSDHAYFVVMDENSFGADAITLNSQTPQPTDLRQDRAVFRVHSVLPDVLPENNSGIYINDTLYIQEFTIKVLGRSFLYQDRKDTFSQTLNREVQRYLK